MRVLVYPQSGYISDNLVGQLKRSGHEVIVPACEGSATEDGAGWSPALQQAAAVFHVLHGHEQHAKQTLLQLLQSTTPQAPVTFVGISTPLTWAAAPPPPPAAAAAPQAAGEPAEQQGPAQEDPPSSGEAASSAGRFTAEDAPRRRPAASAVGTFHCEQLVLRANRPGRLHTHVVCPGVLYGCGEADDQLHGLWRQAWEGQMPLQVHGSGANRLPTIHVQDLAAFCEALVLQQQSQLQEAQAQAALTQQGRAPQRQQQQPHRQQGRYLLAADTAPVTQRQLVAAVGHLLVHSQLRSNSPSLLGKPVSPLLLLDLPFSCSPLAQPYFCCCPHGLLGHLPQVLQELLAARNLSPLRILIRGPPAAGKTHLGMRLAQLYGLPHVNVATILAQLQHMDAETQKAANAQLNSREGRLSSQLMARLAQHLLLKHPTALKQGWVLEGWPRSLSAALLATFVSAAGSGGSNSSSSGGAEVAGKAGGRRDSTGSLGVKADKRRSTATSSGGAAGGGRGRRTQGNEELEAGEGLSLQCPDLMPHFLIELDVSEEELQARVKALAAAEAAQAAATAAADASAARAANGASNGSNKKAAAAAAAARPSAVGTVSAERAGSAVALAAAAVAPSSPFVAAHNNLKDWGRRMEAYRQVVQEDAADLASKRAAVVAAYQAQLAAEAAAAAVMTAAAGGSSEEPQAAAKAGSKPVAADKAGGAPTGGGSRMGTPRTHGKPSAAGTDGCQLPPDVTLPEYEGFVAYFVEGGARHLKFSNPTDSTVAAATFPHVVPSSRGHTPRQAAAAATSAAAQPQPAAAAAGAACTESSAAVLPLVSLEQQLLSAVGPPHNYVGLPKPSTALTTPAAAADAAARDSGSAARAAVSQAQGCSAAACAAAAAGSLARRAAGENSSLPDMGQLRAAAEALAAEAAARDTSQVCRAARPLSAALMESLMGDLMAGLVAVALDRPADPCQVIAERLLEGAARQKAAYQDPYADPLYAIQLGKVKAKEAREAARAAAAAAKAARDAAAAAEATGAAEAAGATVTTTAAVADCGNSAGDSLAGASVGGKSVGAGCDRPPSSKAAGQKGSGRAAGGRASVAHGGAQPAR